jgi:hypothetical protein
MDGAKNRVVVWPRWASAVIVATGLVVIVVETTSFLVVPGIILVGLGIYGLLTGSRARRGLAAGAAFPDA